MLGIYIHIPFCVKKCNYCDFASVAGNGRAEAYLHALKQEIVLAAELYRDKVATVYLGGGTPGYLPDGSVAQLMQHIKEYFPIAPYAEITIETNPCVVTPAKLTEYKESGINRISMGLQAAQDELLRFLGRQHTAEQFEQAYRMAETIGFDNINVDLIYAIPRQSMLDWEQTVAFALQLQPKHISAYALSIEPDTPFGRRQTCGELLEVDEDVDAAMYDYVQHMLEQSGYTNYEISNFAVDRKESEHNLRYWNLKNYLGMGVAAHSYVDFMRFHRTGDIDAYIRQMDQGNLRYEGMHRIDEKARHFEYVMLQLRLKKGISYAEYKREFHEEFEARYREQIDKAVAHGLAVERDGRLMPTRRGFALQNQLAGLFL